MASQALTALTERLRDVDQLMDPHRARRRSAGTSFRGGGSNKKEPRCSTVSRALCRTRTGRPLPYHGGPAMRADPLQTTKAAA
jgi:hypothetical protein